jgi:hypothetical protein
MFCRLWLRFYEKEPMLACLLAGALLVVPIVPLAAIAIDGIVLVLGAAASLFQSGAAATFAAVGHERERQHQLSLEQERTRREHLLIEERARVAANTPPPPTLQERLDYARSRHCAHSAAIALLPVDESTRDALQLEQEERFAQEVRELLKRGKE